MPVNLAVMDVVGRQEGPVFTWNPVEQMWVQERGGAAKPPPPPHDVHAIQTWFLDADEKEWIQTVLGPLGRQLAAQWRGAHRVPDTAIARKHKSASKRSPLLFFAVGAVLIAMIGGVALAAPSLMGSAPTTTAPNGPLSTAPNVAGTTNPVATSTPDASASQVATAEPTVVPTNASAATSRPATPRPATPAPTQRPATPPPDFVTPSVGPVGTVFHFTFTGLPVGGTYRTSYTRGVLVTGYVNGEVPQNGTVQIDLRTASGFLPETYFFTMRSADVVRTVSFRVTG